MEDNFDRCMTFVFEREAGYVDNPKDPGGATNLGITIATLKAWRRHDVTKQDVRDLGKPEARLIYHAWFWRDAWCEALPSGVDLLIFDAAVLSAPGRALDFLKAELGVPKAPGKQHHPAHRPRVDLKMNYLLDELARVVVPDTIRGLCERRRAFYRSLATFSTFGKGWLSRVHQAEELALTLWGADRSQAASRR